MNPNKQNELLSNNNKTKTTTTTTKKKNPRKNPKRIKQTFNTSICSLRNTNCVRKAQN